jgi:hypothetical protein
MKTITISREFFCYALDITEHWHELPSFVTKVYCIAVIQKDERTHIASLTASSRVCELRNEFVCKESDSEKMVAWLETNDGAEHTSEALESVNYYGYVNYQESSPIMSECLEFSDEFEVEDSFDPENDRLPDDVSDSIWDEAIEYFQGNHHSPECCGYEPDGSTKTMYECGSCGEFHVTGFKGDCRDDNNRFSQDSPPVKQADLEDLIIWLDESDSWKESES